MGLIFKDADQPLDPRIQRLWAVLFKAIIGIIACIGILALVLLVHDEIGSGFGLPRQRAMGMLSAAVVCGGLIALLIGVRAKKQAIEESLRKSSDDEEPWLKRKDWAAGRIATTSKNAAVLMWIIVLFWCGGSVAISLAVVPAQLQEGNRTALIALVFPVIGLGLIFFALRTTLAWRRFGKSTFEMPNVPAALGGTLQGKIQLRGNSHPAHGWHIVLSCIRRSTTGPTNNLRTSEKTLWRDEKWLRPELPPAGANATSIPVFFQLPGDKPESTPKTGDGTHWLLEAWAQFPGPYFRARFEVPVFKSDEPQAASEDPTQPYHLSLDEIRKEIHSQIQIRDLADGKEFIFPPGRNPGFALGATTVCLVWTAIVVLLACFHAPLPVPLIFGAMDLLMIYFVFDLWLRRNHVVIAGDKIKIETAWHSFKKEESLKISDAVNFFAEIGTPVGHSTYYDLKLRARDGKEWLLAKNLGHKPEAEWLARQMTAAAKNIPATSANA